MDNPSVPELYADALRYRNCLFQQDNARPHTARATQDFLRHNNVNLLPHPALSPDLNPIEHFWDIMQRRINALARRSRTAAELRAAVSQLWAQVPQQQINDLVLSMYRSHSTCWGYEETDRRGEEVEDWQIDAQMILLNDPEDPPTFFSRRWLSTSTPDLAFATDDLSKKTTRGILSQLGGSDHRPVKLAINLQYRPQNSTTFPRWNYKKADWNIFASLTDLYTRGLKTDDLNINRVTRNFNQAILKAASETIPRGARKNYRPYWTEELQELEDEVSSIREEVEENPSVDNNITLKAATAKYRRAYLQAARSSWREKTEKLNLERDGNKLWKLTKAMNGEDTRAATITISQGQELLTGRKAANLFIDNYEKVSNITVPEERRAEIQEERRTSNEHQPEEHMNKPFNHQELADAMKALHERKSPGPDKITNEMLLHLGTRAKTQLLKLYNNSWKTGHVPQVWREADMVPIHKKGKDRAKVDSYRPISLTSCVGKLMERLINTRLTWHLEKNSTFSPEQAGVRQHRSTEDQVAYIAQKIEDGYQDKKHTLTIWIDMEKAFDKIWKEGLKLKSGVAGCMFQWICQYLNNRKANVHVSGQYSRKKTLKDGVPKGGVLSPTLFLVFINDIVKGLPRNVHGAIYADDLALWCSEEHITTANYRMQEALKVLEDWTKKWLVNINTRKTTYTIFSLSPKELKANLKLCGQTLQADNTPTYLGVTFDRRLTWKQQTEKVEARAKLRLALMKKLTGTTWGADAAILKKMYVSSVRPVLEYGVTAWGTAAKSNFDRVSKVQNQAARIITGAMRSTPIQELENIMGLEPMEDRRDTKLLTQAAKFKRLPTHPMKDRRGCWKGDTKISWTNNPKISPKDIPQYLENPSWSDEGRPQIRCSIPGVGKEDSHSCAELKSLTIEHIHNSYPQRQWTHVYTDGSADQAVRSGGAGIYIKYPGGREEEHISLATGLYSTNFKAEAVALQTGAAHIEHSPLSSNNVVFFSDANQEERNCETGEIKSSKEAESRRLPEKIAVLSINTSEIYSKLPITQPVTQSGYMDNPSVPELYADALRYRNCLFQQDNARPHTARATQDFLRHNNVNLLPHPALSPDLNPIEHFWDIMQRRINALARRSRTAAELRAAVSQLWAQVPQQQINDLVLSMYRSHSTCWGYEETDRRGEEVEDWQIDAQMILLNDPEDPPTFFSRRWLSTSTPDLAFATDDLSKKTTRGILSQLGGSDHRPVKLAINLQYRPQNSTTFPRWNYKKADWNIFASLTDLYTRGLKTDDLNINRVTRNFNQAILKAASETIPRGARKNYRPYWTEELQELEDEVSSIREEVEENPSVDNNITLKAATAKYRRAYLQAARSSWREKTEKLNLERDGNKLWKLTKAMNGEDTRAATITISQGQELLTGRKAANLFIDNYEKVSNITVPEERRAEIQEERRTSNEHQPEEHMNKPFNHQELADAMKALHERKSPGPDKITNEMLLHLGTRAKTQLLKLYNNSWKTGHVPQVWREADMVPIHKKGKDRAKVDSYRPISLTSCVGILMERLINTRLTWHLEKNNTFSPEQAGFRQHRSTEDQVAYIAQKIEDGYQDKKHTLTIWIDMEKAFDKIWKEGLKLKSGVAGCMFQWICQYLNNRKAKLHVSGQYSRKKTLKDGVPKGGVLSPTLFLGFINDIVKDLPRNVHGAIYADDLALWCSEEHITTANYRMQEALKVLEDWTKKWLVNINTRKTTYTIFSLSPKELKANLKLCGQTLQADNTPTYLGVTFDRRLTWKQQTEKVEARAKLRLALMKKLTGTTWGADAAILKKMYVSSVRPVLEYGVTAWGTAAKSNFDRVSKVQNQAARIITGAMRSTPIQELENIMGLEPMEDRRDTKLLTQAAKFKRLPTHPMKDRRGCWKGDTKISWTNNPKISPKDIPQYLENPSWSDEGRPQIRCSIPGVGKEDSHSCAELKSLTIEHIHNSYPQRQWTHVYTDGSADQAVRSGGAGIYIKYPGGREEEHISLATGLYSTNFKAEAVALQTGAAHIEHSPLSSNNVVFFSDANQEERNCETVGGNKIIEGSRIQTLVKSKETARDVGGTET
ncbi:uncharacterized protein [Littorina saxatilis]|uniref:uncharacterized protein n=1 Tax=Littorina saxatilis TaxID=31220 RepID=UPI0038B514C0